MSFIDREAAIRAIENDCLEAVYYTKRDAIDCIEAQPGVDVDEVRHGEWGFDGIGWTCSECGEYALSIKTNLQSRSKYCPNCGAKMDGERREE